MIKQQVDSSFIQNINTNFDKVMENLEMMKQFNVELMKEVFLNEVSSIEDTSIEYSNYNDCSR